MLTKYSDHFDNYYTYCDDYIYLIGRKKFPPGIRMSRGTDWILVTSDYANYMVNSNDVYWRYLKDTINNSTILSSEVREEFKFLRFINFFS